jgi:hypothetical protein
MDYLSYVSTSHSRYIHLLTCIALYPLLYYAYYHKYDEYIKSEEWTFIYCVLLGAGHALSFLTTAWSSGVNAKISYTTVSSPPCHYVCELIDGIGSLACNSYKSQGST